MKVFVKCVWKGRKHLNVNAQAIALSRPSSWSIWEHTDSCDCVYRLTHEERTSSIEKVRRKDTHPVFSSHAAETDPLNIVSHITKV